MRKIVVSQLDQARLQEQIKRIEFQQGHISQEVAKLQEALEQAQIVETHLIPDDVVTLNTVVVVKFLSTGKEFKFRLVYPKEANAKQDRVSVFSPIGVALLGYQRGDVIQWNAPGGKINIQVKDIIFQPERAEIFQL
ncbi:MAG: nucleoside diphosphate kinase regulator [Bacteroidota bacterium]